MRETSVVKPSPLLSILAFVLLLALLPLFFGQLMVAGLAKLQLSPATALALVIAIMVGGFVNIPLRRFARDEEVAVHPLAIFGFHDVWPRMRRTRRETVIAVNVGGCLIPAGLALYELLQLDPPALFAVAVAAGANIYACYRMATPLPGVGIALPALVPPLIAAALAMLLAPAQAAPVAFVAGVAGPLVGADLLHLKDIRATAFGIASIGGAGTFDGIVLSGIVAAYLA
jgi:uncharacterized membrane protein